MRRPPTADGHLIVSAVEHPAVLEPAKFLQSWGYDATIVGCDADGLVDPQKVVDAIGPATKLVSIMHANNETGVIQPIREIAALCRARGVLCHTDAAQSLGKVRVAVEELGVDLLTVAGHKIYAPKGVGALYVRRGTPVAPVQHGAGHEAGLRAGTENVPYIVALGKAAALLGQGLTEAGPRMETLRDRLLRQLQREIPGLTVNGAGAPRLPNTLNVNLPRVDANDLLGRVPELCASTGAACHSGKTHISATLAAMGVPVEVATGAVRLSLGWHTTEEEVDRAASLLIHAWETAAP